MAGLVLAALLLASCGHSLKNFPLDRGVGTQISPAAPGLQVRYHSVGCFYICYGEHAVLTDPFWSHLSFADCMVGRIAPDPEQIEPHLPPLHDVRAVCVAHGHYDHALALPYISPRLPADALIMGSKSLKHQFAASAIAQPFQVCNDRMALPEQPGVWTWLADSALRILPVRAAHPPQYLGIHLYKKNYSEDRTTPPTKISHYQEGQTLGFLMDFFVPGSKDIAYRVYFESSNTAFPSGAFPKEILAERKVDVALLPMDCARNARQGEYTLIDYIDAKTVIFCHWENFFRDKTRTPRDVMKVHLKKIKAYFEEKGDRRYIFPAWDSVYAFESE